MAARTQKKAAWTRQRGQLAHRLAEGLSGWLQLQGAQGTDELPGEDSARLVICQIIRATGRYSVATSQRPTNWPSTDKKRIDVAVLGRNSTAKGWYGAIEVKWPGSKFAVDAARLAVVQDCVRLAATTSTNLRATLLVVGGSAATLKKLFDKKHKKSALEDCRLLFAKLLPRSGSVAGRASNADLKKLFPKYGDRTPLAHIPHGTILATPLASSDASRDESIFGAVHVWNISKQRGRKRKAPAT